ncbi:MAG: glycosyltransferase WbuB [Solirubrobacterales bacterium]|jgi:glycosyltransferase involved in cell wall biosynthesis|nr:glycosyltransferase WbuB [Solirubrobacterales bacterium]
MSAHVLIVTEGLPHPFDVRVRAEVAALREAGYEVTVAGPTGYGHDAREELLDGVSVHRFRAPPAGRGALGYLREFAVAWVRLGRLVYRIHRRHPVDLVFVCNPPDIAVLLALPLKWRGVPILFDYREICPELFEAKFQRRGALHRLLLLGERLAFRCADVVITVSRPCAEIVATRGRTRPERVFLVGNGPDAERIFPVSEQPELRRGRRHLVLWLGAMSSQEGLERLVEAAEELVLRRGREDISFALIGPGDAHEELRREVSRRGLDHYVEVSEAVDDDLVRAYLSTAEVCVNVDERNDMNDRAAMRKVLEYMAMGRAIVQFPLTEMRRLCADTTLYARNADASDIAEQVAVLLDDEPRRLRLGAAARERVMDGLMWEQQVPALLHAVRSALGERAPASTAPRRRSSSPVQL